MIVGLRISMQKLFKNANNFHYQKMRKYISEIIMNKEEKKIKIAIHALKSLYDTLLSNIHLIQSLCGKGNLYNQKNLDIAAIDSIIHDIGKEILKLNKFKPKSSKEKNDIKEEIIINNEEYLAFIEKSILNTFEKIEIFNDGIFKLYYAVFNIWHKKSLAYESRNSNKFGEKLNIFNFSENISKYLDLNFKKILTKYIIINKNKNDTNTKVEEAKNSDFIYLYQDDEFYNNLLKDIISAKDIDGNEDNFSNKSRFDYTYNYLLNRSQNSKKKTVDTKASKNRKLRFDTHEKLINFMVPVQNLNLHVGRDAFIKSIFGLINKQQTQNLRNIDEINKIADNDDDIDFI